MAEPNEHDSFLAELQEPDTGELQLREIIACLKASKYAGPLGFEFMPSAVGRERAIKNTLRLPADKPAFH